MENLRGLILSGGAGTRLRPITHTSAKQLVPVANKPVLFYGIEALIDAGINEIGVIVNPETGGEIEACVREAGFGSDVNFEFIRQDRPGGLAHAMLTAADFLGDSPFVMYLGDNILRDGVRDLVARFREVEPEALIQLTEVPDPQHYGVAELDGDRVVRLVEKPQVPPSNMALVGVYMFAPVILDAARRIEPSARGELEITDAIQTLIDDGLRVESHTVTGWWKDTGQLHDMLEANHLVLEALSARTDGDVDDSSKIEGRVVIEAGAKVERSHLRGPVVIGAGAQVTDAYIGPYTAIGNDVKVTNAEIENSILLAGARVENLDERLADSLLGRDARLVRGDSKARALRMIIGDNSEVLVP